MNIKLLFRDNMEEYIENIKKDNQEALFWSISRLNSYNQCKRSYYYKYINKKSQKPSIYSTLGTACHSSLEELYQGKTNTLNKKYFTDEWKKCEIFGVNFPNSKYDIKGNYKKDIDTFYNIYKKRDGKNKKFISELGFVYRISKVDYLMGYIDLLIINEDNTCDIVDFKTSSTFDKNHIISAGRQLILYKLAIEQLYGIKVNSVAWEMLKYVTVQIGDNKSKDEINGREWVKKCFAQIKTLMKKNGYDEPTISTLLNKAQVDNDISCLPKAIQNKIKVRTRIREYNVTDELIEECQEYIKKTISSIKAKGESIDEWNCSVDNFFCNNLCGFSCNSCEFDNNFSNGAL